MESLLGNTSQSKIQGTSNSKISIHKYKGKMHFAIISRQVYSWWEVKSGSRGKRKVGQEQNLGKQDRRRGSDVSFPLVSGLLSLPFLSPLKP